MQTRISLADLPLDQQLCLRTAVRCNGLAISKVGFVGRLYAEGEYGNTYRSHIVAALSRRGLLEISPLGCAATPTSAGVAVIDGNVVAREVAA